MPGRSTDGRRGFCFLTSDPPVSIRERIQHQRTYSEANDGKRETGKSSPQEYQESKCSGSAEADDRTPAEVGPDRVRQTGREGSATEAIQGSVVSGFAEFLAR